MTTIGTETKPAYVYDAETDTWVPIGIGSHTHDEYIDRTIINAKGDILVGVELDAVDRLGVGTTGQVLVVNPSTPTGLEWANKQETITGAASSITTTNLTSSRALASDISGKVSASAVTATELSHLSGVTSAIQGQLNEKSPTAGSTSLTTLGTVATGTWNATTIGVARGGTGATTLASGGYLKGAGTSAITSQAGIPAGDITSGSLAYARFPAGTVVQVNQGVYTGSEIGNSSATYADSGLTSTITPRFSNSRILVIVFQTFLKNTSNASNAVNTRILRDSTVIKTISSQFLTGTATELHGILSYSHDDFPNTTSAITYKTQFANAVNSSVIIANRGHQPTMLLFEIRQ